jgi:hypothetical protein
VATRLRLETKFDCISTALGVGSIEIMIFLVTEGSAVMDRDTAVNTLLEDEVDNTSGTVRRDFVSTEETLTVKDSAIVPYLVVALNSATDVDFIILVILSGSPVVAGSMIIEGSVSVGEMMEFSVIEGFKEVPVIFVAGDMLEYSVVDSAKGIDNPWVSLDSKVTEGELDKLRDFLTMLGFAMLVGSEGIIEFAV